MSGKTISLMMSVKLKQGKWIECEDRQPTKYGIYMVVKRGRSRHLDYDKYLWNGSGWVTHGGSLSKAVEAWFEEETEDA